MDGYGAGMPFRSEPEGDPMPTPGALTIRFADGEQWTIPFSADEARRLARSLDESDPPEWLLLGDPDEDDPAQILFVRPHALQSMAWEREDDEESSDADAGGGSSDRGGKRGKKPIVPVLLKGLGEGLDPERRSRG
jgi:hypothetical protein